jgi:polar amino acid transport system substrate-binding protein
VPPHASAAGLAEIKQRGYLVVGVKDNLAPLGFRNAEGQLEGLEIDLAHRLAADLLGNPEAIAFQPLTNQERLSALLDGKVDLVIARMTATPARARLVSFSTTYYVDGTAFITRSATVQTLRDLQQPIAILNGSDTVAVVRSLLPRVHLVGVDAYDQAKSLLESGQAIAFAADATVLTGWAQADPQYHLLPILISAESLSVAVPKGLQYDELRRYIDAAIERWRAEGFLEQRVLHWGLPEDGIPGHSLGESR